MLVIRLSRTGRTKRPHYRVVVAEKSAPVKGRFLEVLGNYDPRSKALEIDVEAAKKRIAAGAQPSETAEALLEKAGVLKRDKVTIKNRRPTKQTKNPSDAPPAPAEGEATPASEGAPAAGDTPESAEVPAAEVPEEVTADASAENTPADKAPAASSDEQATETTEEPAAETTDDTKA